MNETLAHEVPNSDSSGQKRSRMNQTGAKSELLEDLDREQQKPKNLSAHTLIWTYIILFFVLLFILPKIYIANQIYYISKDINTKYHKYTALLEEKRHLQKKIEELQYQNQVVDEIDTP